MLGKLTRWMRMIGCDVEYFSKISDKELVERAWRTRRIILTRDTLLIQRRKARSNHFFVQGDGYKDQLRQVVKEFSIDPMSHLLTRCLLCNEPLLDIDKPLVKNSVPPYVYETQDAFKTCPSCGRFYWGATHREEMVEQLKEILAG